MKKSVAAYAAVLVLALGGCQSLRSDSGARLPEGAEITRTHLGQPIARGEIRVEPEGPATAGDPAFAQEEAAVGRELSRLGWMVTPSKATTEQVAVVRVGQTTTGDRVATELRVGLKRRSDASFFWEGRARMEARTGSALADRGAAVDALAVALFRDFPGESGRTIRAR